MCCGRCQVSATADFLRTHGCQTNVGNGVVSIGGQQLAVVRIRETESTDDGAGRVYFDGPLKR